jgi:transketolase
MSDRDLEQLAINTIRGLSMDGPQAANSGHPGTAMALAPLAHVLWTRVMKYDAADPNWPDRDRFILSVGHASILLYSMLYLSGTDLTLDDIKQFRQWDSRTPGHPEIHHVKGIDVTTGPLGQGFANAVGMAIAERMQRERFGADLCDHYVYTICGDGDMQEGVSHESASLAGHLGLGRLIAIYDDNHITIDGPTELSFTDNTPERFRAYGWHVMEIGEVANDTDALENAINEAKQVDDKPTLIVLRSHIGFPSPKYTDTEAAHGNPLGDDEVAITKEIMGLPKDEKFYVPQQVLELYRAAGVRGTQARNAWTTRKNNAKNLDEFEAALAGKGLPGWAGKLPTWSPDDKPLATRVAIAKCINAVLDGVPALAAGGADLTGNTGTKLDGQKQQSRENPDGRQILFGVREHGMAATMVGMAYHGGVLPVGGTFFAFVDYMKPSVRLAAMGEAHVIFNWTHDSVGLGEDGPTHQPIEHLASVRSIPQLQVLRPADANETAHAFRVAVDGDRATGLVLSRQNLPVLEGTSNAYEGVKKGAYVLKDTTGTPDVILVGTGSEVQVCVGAAELLASKNITARVVSMPSWDLFEAAGPAYQAEVLVPGVPKLSVEAASSFGWARWVDDSVSIDRYGASAPGAVALKNFGFTPENVCDRAEQLLMKKKK